MTLATNPSGSFTIIDSPSDHVANAVSQESKTSNISENGKINML